MNEGAWPQVRISVSPRTPLDCHDKFGPPCFCSPRSIYFKIFGPPGPYISEIYGPPVKYVDPLVNVEVEL